MGVLQAWSVGDQQGNSRDEDWEKIPAVCKEEEELRCTLGTQPVVATWSLERQAKAAAIGRGVCLLFFLSKKINSTRWPRLEKNLWPKTYKNSGNCHCRTRLTLEVHSRRSICAENKKVSSYRYWYGNCVCSEALVRWLIYRSPNNDEFDGTK